jgi:hypothetical protein
MVQHQMRGRVSRDRGVQRARRTMALPRRGLRTWVSAAIPLFGVRGPQGPQGDAGDMQPGAEGIKRRAYDRPGGGMAPPARPALR